MGFSRTAKDVVQLVKRSYFLHYMCIFVYSFFPSGHILSAHMWREDLGKWYSAVQFSYAL